MKNPKIRFKGYTDDWEQRKLGELVGIYDGVHQTPEYQDSGIMFLSVENIATLKSEKYISEEAFERDYKVYPEKGDILMTRIGDVGTTNVIETAEKVAFYVSLALLKPNGIDSYFLSNVMKTNIFQKGLRERTLVTAIPQKINKDEIGKIHIFTTNNNEEQQIIGAYFTNLDHLITLHQRKCEQTKILKKYMLQKMFPQNGEKVPEIRFNGFTDDWEQRKLGDATKEFKSGNSLKADEIDTTGEYPVYGGNGLRGYTTTYNHDGEFALIGRQGALCGNTNYTVGKAYFTEHAVVVQADENNDTRFMYYMLSTMNLGQYSDQSAQPGLAVNKLVKLENLFPKKKEQQRIGSYYKSLDHLITLHQRKCVELQNIKKFMLQNMFV